MTDPRDFLNRELHKMALEAAKDVEFKIMLGCSDCGLRLVNWIDEMMTTPRGYLVEENNILGEKNTEVYCKDCYDRRFMTDEV